MHQRLTHNTITSICRCLYKNNIHRTIQYYNNKPLIFNNILCKYQHTQVKTNNTQQQHYFDTQHNYAQESPRPNITTTTDTTHQSPILSEANNQHHVSPTQNNNNNDTTQSKPQQQTNITPDTKQPTTKPRIRPNLAAIQLTEAASNRIKHLLSTQNNAVGIRLGVRSRGCSGLSYTINYAYADKVDVVKNDDVVKQHDVTVYIEKKSLFYIVGTTMDYIDTELASEFVFHNPKAKSQCGCGESFNV